LVPGLGEELFEGVIGKGLKKRLTYNRNARIGKKVLCQGNGKKESKKKVHLQKGRRAGLGIGGTQRKWSTTKAWVSLLSAGAGSATGWGPK